MGQNVSDLPDFEIRISSTLTLTISPEQYTTQSSSGAWCLDISLDWDDGVCLGSHAMEHYLILYDDEMQNIGVFDNNTKHKRAFDGDSDVDGGGDHGEDEEEIEILESAEERQYLYALSLAVLICLVCVAMVCVVLVRRVSQRKRGASNSVWRWSKEPRRQSITIDLAESPKLRAEHIVMDHSSPQKLQLDRDANLKGIKTKGQGQAHAKASKGKALQFSPQKYYDGNFKSIVYDRVIRPRHIELEIQQQEAERMRRDQEDFDAL